MRNIEVTLKNKIQHLLNKNNINYEKVIIKKVPAFTQTFVDTFTNESYEESFEDSYMINIICDFDLLPNKIFNRFSQFEINIEKRHGFHIDIVTYKMESDIFRENP